MVKWDECRRIRSYLYVCAAPVGKKHYIPLYIDTHADFNLLGQEGLSLGACNVAYYERLMPIYLFAFCLFFRMCCAAVWRVARRDGCGRGSYRSLGTAIDLGASCGRAPGERAAPTLSIASTLSLHHVKLLVAVV